MQEKIRAFSVPNCMSPIRETGVRVTVTKNIREMKIVISSKTAVWSKSSVNLDQ